MIVMTGATGFLGSHLLQALLDSGREVCVLKRSFSNTRRIDHLLPSVRILDLDREDPEVIFRTRAVETVLHCATDYGRRDVEPYRVVEANIVLPLKLLHLASRFGARSFINSDTILDKRIGHYSLSKNQFFQWLEIISSELVCANVALEHFYGVGDDGTKFVPYILRALIGEAPHIDLTPGEQQRYFIHVDDVVAAYLAILAHSLEQPPGLLRFEVGARAPITIKAFVLLAKALCGNVRTELRFGALPYREQEIMAPGLDLTPIENLGWSPRIALETGLTRTIAGERATLARTPSPSPRPES